MRPSLYTPHLRRVLPMSSNNALVSIMARYLALATRHCPC
jgi:hypothetical protein